MKLVLYLLALGFCLFPYTQIVRLESYTQPYAIVFSVLAATASFPRLRAIFPARDAFALALLAGLGLVGFLIGTLPDPNAQELKYLLLYVSPLFFAAAAFGIAWDHPVAADRMLVFGTCAWMFVGLVQLFISPAFLSELIGAFSDASEVVLDSGRGVLGLAPEPTHFGFHMVILSAALVLVGGRNMLAIACLVVAVMVARSSSALLAMALGALIYVIFYTRKARLLLLAVPPAYVLLGALLKSGALAPGTRIVALLSSFYDAPLDLITSDYSANARLGGIWVGLLEIVHNAFLPAGLSNQAWVQQTGRIMSQNSWLLGLSESGVPSGILIVVYQLGVFGLLLMAYFSYRIMSGLRSHIEAFLVCATMFVFLSQYMISAPGFGLIYGFALARRKRAEAAAVLPPPVWTTPTAAATPPAPRRPAWSA